MYSIARKTAYAPANCRSRGGVLPLAGLVFQSSVLTVLVVSFYFSDCGLVWSVGNMSLIDVEGVRVNFPFQPYPCQISYMEKVIQCLQQVRWPHYGISFDVQAG
jgi:hypothetical protein